MFLTVHIGVVLYPLSNVLRSMHSYGFQNMKQLLISRKSGKATLFTYMEGSYPEKSKSLSSALTQSLISSVIRKQLVFRCYFHLPSGKILPQGASVPNAI